MVGDEAALAASPAASEDATALQDPSNGSASAGASAHVLRATAEPIFATLADAEDASFGFLTDLVDDIFAGMRVAEENERAVRVAVAHAWTQALSGARVAAATASPSVDATDKDATKSQFPQFLRARIHVDDDPLAATRRHRRLNRAQQPVTPFLAALWTLVDRQAAFVEAQLARFPSARFQASVVSSCGRAGEWAIPVADLAPFLQRLARAARLSALGSAACDVVAANAPFLEKKAAARGTLQMSHIALCVQTALLYAEQRDDESATRGLGLEPTASGVFQTEVASATASDDDEFVVYYDEGVDHAPPAIDRKATGTVSHKPELGSTIAKRQRMAKSVLSLMQRRDSGNSKWGAVRKRMVVRENHVGVAIETDMALDATTPVTALQKTTTAATLLTSSPKKKASASAATPRHFREPDAATLANIFSLGTPRQLSPEELARRNDILSLLEREEATASRKMAVASITAVSVPPPCMGPDGKPIVSDQDKAFQAYVAAHSSVTVTSGSCVVPAVTTMSPEKTVVDSAGKPPSDPKRMRALSDGQGKTRFELALDPPRFEIADGNSHVRMAAAAAAAAEAMSRKTRTRGGVRSPAYTPSPPGSPARKLNPQPPSPQHQQPTVHNPRPLETASGHLPQLDTSRLAVGVKAVVRGVEKRGPRHDPSRNSRLRLHNYAATGDPDEQLLAESPMRLSPEKRDHLPPVSPVKASPHRKHVAFPPAPADVRNVSPQRPTMPLQEPSPIPPSGLRRFPAKQPTFEKRASPPRVRNRVLTENANNATSKKHFARAKWAERDANDELAAMHAPRRNLTHSETMADY